MTEARVAAKHRPARRPPEAALRLDRPRKRNVDHLQAQRDTERRIETALQAYVALEQQIEQTRAAAQNHITQIRQQQAIAVWHMSHAGHTVQQISELLEITQKDTRWLLSAGRTAAAHQPTLQPTDDRPSNCANPSDQQQLPAPHWQSALPNMPSENNGSRAGSMLINTAQTRSPTSDRVY
jgi:hypothetical protein